MLEDVMLFLIIYNFYNALSVTKNVQHRINDDE
jgi:hypothetical protein